MSVYFNNSLFKIDRVLSQRDRNTKTINELARRRNISIAEKGKYKKRKRKTKGKHRKGKKEITIDNQPTQQVKGYSVVNVISAKRGKYKPRRMGDDKKYPDVAPMWFKEGKGVKGSAWKFTKSPIGTGLMVSASDNRYKSDPKDKEQLKTMKKQIKKLEDRLAGGGNQPAQQNPAGPLSAVGSLPLGASATPSISAGGVLRRRGTELLRTPAKRPPPPIRKMASPEERGKWFPSPPAHDLKLRDSQKSSSSSSLSGKSRVAVVTAEAEAMTEASKMKREGDERRFVRTSEPVSTPSEPRSESSKMMEGLMLKYKMPSKPAEDVGAPSPQPDYGYEYDPSSQET
mgnify:CR=1 FL=1